MDNVHTETMLRQFPGLVVNAMENGGMCFTDDGEYMDAADLLLDPNRVWVDFENGDGARGHIPLSAEDFETDEEREAREDKILDEEDELKQLIAEQAADDADTNWKQIEDAPFAEFGDDIVEPHRVPIARENIANRGRRHVTRRTADRKPLNGPIYIERDSHGFHGRKPTGIDRTLRLSSTAPNESMDLL